MKHKKLANLNQLSRDLATYLAYLQLMTSLHPGEGNITQPANSYLRYVQNFYMQRNAKALRAKGLGLIKSLEPMVSSFKNFALPKVSIEAIANDFNTLCAENKDLYSYGIEYRWLSERMDCSRMGFPKALPWHAKIGIGHHAGKVGIEELFLLHDAFFILQSAEDAFANMHAYANEVKKQGKSEEPNILDSLTLTNQDVAAYSRLSIITFYSFIEAFVNSVGYNFGLENQKSLGSDQLEILNGKKKGHLTSLEYKLEKFPSIIRADKKSPIVISDPVQLGVRQRFLHFTAISRRSGVFGFARLLQRALVTFARTDILVIGVATDA